MNTTTKTPKQILADARLLTFLVQRVQFLKQTPPPPPSTYLSTPPNSNNKAQQEKDDDDEPPPELQRRIVRAAQAVAKTLMEPPETRKDLKVHVAGRAVVTKIRRKDVDGVRADLTEMPLLTHMRDSTNAYTLLHIAAKDGAAAICQVLMEEFHMDPWDTDLLGRSALHIAADGLHEDACRVIQQHMGDCVGENAPRDACGITPAAVTARSSSTSAGGNSTAKRATLAKLLHRVGDACISPLPSNRKPPRSGGSRRGGSSVVNQRNNNIDGPSFGSFTMPGMSRSCPSNTPNN